LPTEKKDGLATTILQQAGSILLEVEKQNVKHFEVETPYLAAVVKGTQFIVRVNRDQTSVSVIRGQVEVSDFKSGQIAQVMPGQVASTFTNGKSGLSLSGSGTLNPVEQGKPRASSIDRIPVPKGGLTAPQKPGDGKVIHALARTGSTIALATTPPPKGQSVGVAPMKRNVIRISSALGEVKLNVNKATHGLARGAGPSGNVRNASSKDSTSIWSDTRAGSTSSVVQLSSNGSSSSAGASSGSSTSTAATSSGGSTAAAVTAAASNSGNGNEATGNGNGNSQGNNGNGNGGVGNGNGKGNAKH
jgi:hypothetical protein